jgi:hypothetical protein
MCKIADKVFSDLIAKEHTFTVLQASNFVTGSSAEYSYKVTIVHPDLAVN